MRQELSQELTAVTIKEYISKGTKGLESYLERNCSHLSILSRTFDRNRGQHRAQIYQQALGSDQYSLLQKLLVMHALLAAKDGLTLQQDVAEAITGTRDVAAARQQVDRLIGQSYLDKDFRGMGQQNEFNKIAQEIVKFANDPKPEQLSLPESIWNGITKKRYFYVGKTKPLLMTHWFFGNKNRVPSKSQLVIPVSDLNRNTSCRVFDDIQFAEYYAKSLYESDNTKVPVIYTVELSESEAALNVSKESVTFKDKGVLVKKDIHYLNINSTRLQKLIRADIPDTKRGNHSSETVTLDFSLYRKR